MFRRATGEYEAKHPAGVTTSTPPHAKQLFSPRSPSLPSRVNGNIVKHLRKPSLPKVSAPVPALTPQALNMLCNKSKAVSFASPPPSSIRGARRNFASLCHQPGSFNEDKTKALGGEESTSAITRVKPAAFDLMYIADGDLSDDNSLELDLERPSPLLPSLTATRIKGDDGKPALSSPGTAFTWSQSSPSHQNSLQNQASNSIAHPRAKRQISVVDEGLPPQPAAKKRTLPASFLQSKAKPAPPSSSSLPPDFVGNSNPLGAPPMSKSSRLPWNATASTVRERKRLLKDEQRRAMPAGSDFPTPKTRDLVPAQTSSAKSKSALSLSKEQEHVKNLVCDKNQSVFFTGPAGTGKSVLMRAIITELKKKWSKDPDRLAVTASTGLAACNIGGMTLHSFAGIGLGKEDIQVLVKKIRRNPKAKNRWLRTKTLIIDEISMVDGDLFDKLSAIGRIIRNNGRPWGGIQLVITGDFFQLPPVPEGGANKRDTRFAFEAVTWNTSIDHTIGLTEVFRQKDPGFAHMLNEMRLGRISDNTVLAFKSLSRPLHFEDGLEYTELFPTRTEVDSSNKERLLALPSKTFRYEAVDTGDPAHRERLLQNMMAPKSLELKRGAQVMLIKNMDDSLVNGSLGTVVDFMNEATFQIMGPTNRYESDADGEAVGRGPVDIAFKARIKAFGHQLEDSSAADNKEYPLVRFHAVDGTPRVLLCVPEEWKVELPTGEVQASRRQVPLILAWALSIHKAQGQTLERVKVDLGKVFEKGQAYVALSRATTQQGLQVLRFEKHKVMAHPRVVQFYDKLYSAETALSRKVDPVAGQARQKAAG